MPFFAQVCTHEGSTKCHDLPILYKAPAQNPKPVVSWERVFVVFVKISVVQPLSICSALIDLLHVVLVSS